MLSELREKALQHAETAVAQEVKGAIGEAFRNYRHAVSLLLELSEHIESSDLKRRYLDLAEQYINRCYDLQKTPSQRGTPINHQSAIKILKKQPVIADSSNQIPDPIAFKDIIGLEDAKKALQEAVVYPIQHPEWFKGIRHPWHGILLYGPPGCGKTMLARAAASMLKVSFVSVDPAMIFSKWVGESEQNISRVFQTAAKKQPAIVFIDEIDSIATHRGQDHEIGVEKRVKTQLMTHMDGLKTSRTDKILILAATNIPWELDQAFRRRFEKRIFVGLPALQDRKTLFASLLRTLEVPPTTIDFDRLAKKTKGYTCADITLICREAAMQPIRDLNLEQPISPTSVELRSISNQDFENAFQKVIPSITKTEIGKYDEWRQEFARK